MSALYFDGRLLEQEDPSPRVNVRQFTKIGQNHKSKMVHVEGSTRNNSLDLGKNQSLMVDFKSKKIHLQQSTCDNSPDSGKNTGLLEQEDPSPRVYVQQFTKLGQNRK
eukprot:scaffold13898_cov77-Cylindrotheca_fusiformis.AAC.1